MFKRLKNKLTMRRNGIIEGRIREMVSRSEQYSIFNDLFFESARGYAIEKGAKAAEANSASARVEIDGTFYVVVFCKAAGGGTVFDVEEAAAVKRRIFDKPMENFLRSSKPAAAGGDTMSNAFEVGGFSFNGEASDDKVIAEVISRIVRRIVEMSPTELDLYRYVMEEADRMSDEG